MTDNPHNTVNYHNVDVPMPDESLTKYDLLEAIAEAIRQARRSYVKEFQLCSVVMRNENEIELDIIDNGQKRRFFIDCREILLGKETETE